MTSSCPRALGTPTRGETSTVVAAVEAWNQPQRPEPCQVGGGRRDRGVIEDLDPAGDGGGKQHQRQPSVRSLSRRQGRQIGWWGTGLSGMGGPGSGARRSADVDPDLAGGQGRVSAHAEMDAGRGHPVPHDRPHHPGGALLAGGSLRRVLHDRHNIVLHVDIA
jgi:hypothetical protein